MNLSTKVVYVSFGMLLTLMLSMWLPTPTTIFIAMLLGGLLMIVLVISVLKGSADNYPELQEHVEGDYLND